MAEPDASMGEDPNAERQGVRQFTEKGKGTSAAPKLLKGAKGMPAEGNSVETPKGKTKGKPRSSERVNREQLQNIRSALPLSKQQVAPRSLQGGELEFI